MTRGFLFATVGSLLACAAPAVEAQDPVKWTATTESAVVETGGKLKVVLKATIDGGWKVYSMTQGPGGPVPTRITVPEGQPFKLDGKISASAPKMSFDRNFSIEVEQHEGAATFTVPIAVDPAAKTGAHQVKVNARYQVCNASLCLPARTEKLTVAVKLKKGATAS